MRRILKKIASIILIPLTHWYLSKKRKYTSRGTTVVVLPGVFHPGLFPSTTFLLDHVLQQNLTGKNLLELGCGSGLISVMAAKAGALVTACDLSLQAVKNTKLNAEQNRVDVSVKQSDLFDNIDKKILDWIVINPPYYAKEIKNDEELAWHCGKHFEYFHKLFDQLPDRVGPDSQVIMVLTKGCDLERIFSIGNAKGFQFELLKEKDVLFDEKDYLYKLQACNPPSLLTSSFE